MGKNESLIQFRFEIGGQIRAAQTYYLRAEQSGYDAMFRFTGWVSLALISINESVIRDP